MCTLGALVLLILGLVVLVVAAELFVRGAAGIAARVGISPLIVGLTAVACGTSAPELAVSLNASLNGSPDLAVGNVVGSNIFNILFILGCTAIITPLIVEKKLIRIEVPIMIGAALALWFLVRDGHLGQGESALLFTALVGFIVYTVISARRESRHNTDDPHHTQPETRKPIWITIALLIVGLAGIVFGANLLVRGATEIAKAMGVSDLIIGLTIVAAGTSLPELATSFVAALRGHRDIAIGNVIGSNIFNILGILGLTGSITPDGIPVASSVLSFDIPVMLAVCITCLPVLISGCGISRGEALALLAGYLAYTAYLVFNATGHDNLAQASATTLWFVIPLAGVGIVTTALAWWRRRHAPPPIER